MWGRGMSDHHSVQLTAVHAIQSSSALFTWPAGSGASRRLLVPPCYQLPTAATSYQLLPAAAASLPGSSTPRLHLLLLLPPLHTEATLPVTPLALASTGCASAVAPAAASCHFARLAPHAAAQCSAVTRFKPVWEVLRCVAASCAHSLERKWNGMAARLGC